VSGIKFESDQPHPQLLRSHESCAAPRERVTDDSARRTQAFDKVRRLADWLLPSVFALLAADSHNVMKIVRRPPDV
jgi:hypothetical protein